MGGKEGDTGIPSLGGGVSGAGRLQRRRKHHKEIQNRPKQPLLAHEDNGTEGGALFIIYKTRRKYVGESPGKGEGELWNRPPRQPPYLMCPFIYPHCLPARTAQVFYLFYLISLLTIYLVYHCSSSRATPFLKRTIKTARGRWWGSSEIGCLHS